MIELVLKDEYGVDCAKITAIHGGLSAANYKVTADNQTFLMKVYDKKKTQSNLWTENIDCYMPILVWLNENTKLNGRIVRPLMTQKGDYRFEDSDNIYLLFDYIEGENVGKTLTRSQLLEAADITACLHCYGNEIPVSTDKIKEDFSVPFCFSLEQFISEAYFASPVDFKAIMQPHITRLLSKSNEVKQLAEIVKRKNSRMVLCHTDAHGYNLLQGERLSLIDWEGIKLAPAGSDLIMFTKKEYWNVFIERYNKMRPEFVLDNDILLFYILRRKIEDVWAFIESVLYDDLPCEERESNLRLLSECCNSLDELHFEL